MSLKPELRFDWKADLPVIYWFIPHFIGRQVLSFGSKYCDMRCCYKISSTCVCVCMKHVHIRLPLCVLTFGRPCVFLDSLCPNHPFSTGVEGWFFLFFTFCGSTHRSTEKNLTHRASDHLPFVLWIVKPYDDIMRAHHLHRCAHICLPSCPVSSSWALSSSETKGSGGLSPRPRRETGLSSGRKSGSGMWVFHSGKGHLSHELRNIVADQLGFG